MGEWLRRLRRRVRSWNCRLLENGHLFEQKAEPGRLFLRCMQCGHDTPGWNIALERPSLARRRLGIGRSKWSTSTAKRALSN